MVSTRIFGLAVAIVWAATTTNADPHEHSLVECEGSEANITCPEGRFIRILLANYGRFSLLRCNPFNHVEKLDTQCQNPKTFNQLVSLCGEKTRCRLKVSADVFGDPCPGTPKYLETVYTCVEVPTTTTTSTTAPLTADSAEVPQKGAKASPDEENGDKRSDENVDIKATIVFSHCNARDLRGLQWPKTENGHLARIACPIGSEGFAEWQCTESGVWAENGADLSRCVSGWAKNLRADAFSDDNLDDPVAQMQTLKEIQRRTRKDEMFGGDVVSIGEALGVTAERFDRVGADCENDKKDDSDEDCRMRDSRNEKVMSQLVMETVNNLLSSQQRPAWLDLNTTKQSAAAVRLLDAVERSATTLLGTFNDNAVACEPLQRSSVVMEVSVVNIHNYVRFPSMSLYDSSIDSIEVPAEALIGKSAKSDMAKVVYAAYDNLGSYLKPDRSVIPLPGALPEADRRVVSRVLTTSVISQMRPRTVNGLQRPVIITFHTQKQANLTNPTCVWWDRATSDWSRLGCKLRSHNATYTVCECNHLTHFAVLMDVRGQTPAFIHEFALTFLTYAGCTASIICLFICVIAFQLSSSPGNERICIHKNLCLCLLIAECIFVFGIYQTENKLRCGIIAGALQYFFLAAFAWMLLEGIELYHMLVEVFSSARSRKPLLYLVGYGFPALIVSLSVWADPNSFGTEKHCWLRTDNYLILAFVGPVVFVLICNTVFLAMTMCIVCRHSRVGYTTCKHDADTMKEIRSCLKGAIVLLFLLGLTWSFGLLWVDEQSIVWAYAFTVLNSLQGLFIFFFHVAFNDRIRKDLRKWQRRSSWLPMCMRSYTLDDRKRSGAVYIPAGSSSSSSGNGIISSPLPLSSHSSTASEFMYPITDKYHQQQQQLVALLDPRYHNAVQMQLARQGHYNCGIAGDSGYDYIGQVYNEARPYASHANYVPQFYHQSPCLNQDPAYDKQYNNPAHRVPPPSFPPPPPPAPGYGGFRHESPVGLPLTSTPDGPLQDGRLAAGKLSPLSGHPTMSPTSRFASCRPPSSTATKLSSDDSAYSDGSSAFLVYSHDGRSPGSQSGGGGTTVLRMDLSRNPPVFVQDV